MSVSLDIYRSEQNPLPQKDSSSQGTLTRIFIVIDSELKDLSYDEQRIVSLSYKCFILDSLPTWSASYWIERATGLYSTMTVIEHKARYNIEDSKDIWWKNPKACGCTANAIMALNLFNHKYTHELASFEQLEEALQNEEPGTFEISMNAIKFMKPSGHKTAYMGHAFNIIKVVYEDKIGYRLVQSYVDKYTLKNFLSRDKEVIVGFEDLKKRLLIPLRSVLYTQGPWQMLQCVDYQKITSVAVPYQGWTPCTSTRSFKGKSTFKRTSNRKPKTTSYLETASHVIGTASLLLGVIGFSCAVLMRITKGNRSTTA
jgi:hypothetical protein